MATQYKTFNITLRQKFKIKLCLFQKNKNYFLFIILIEIKNRFFKSVYQSRNNDIINLLYQIDHNQTRSCDQATNCLRLWQAKIILQNDLISVNNIRLSLLKQAQSEGFDQQSWMIYVVVYIYFSCLWQPLQYRTVYDSTKNQVCYSNYVLILKVSDPCIIYRNGWHIIRQTFYKFTFQT